MYILYRHCSSEFKTSCKTPNLHNYVYPYECNNNVMLLSCVRRLRDVQHRLAEAFAHFVDAVPLLFGHRNAHVVFQLELVEQPLEHEQRNCEHAKRFVYQQLL